MKVIIIGLVFLFLISPLFRVIIKNLHLVGVYSVFDLYTFIRYKKWNDFNLYGIDCFIGLFGHGKTLTMIHRASLIYKQYGDNVRFFSNVHLNNIPYIELVNFQQLVDLGEEDNNKYIGNIILIDEIENVLNNRNFAKFPLALLHIINQQRKSKTYFMVTSPRFFQIDKMMRQITTRVYICDKFWRFQHLQCFDAWDYENAMNTRDIKRLSNIWWFVKNQDYNAYNTLEKVSKDSAENFISNDESLKRLGDSVANKDAIQFRSRSLVKSQKVKKR